MYNQIKYDLQKNFGALFLFSNLQPKVGKARERARLLDNSKHLFREY